MTNRLSGDDWATADSKKPYKMYAGAVAVFLSTLITQPGSDSMPWWLRAGIVSLVAALAIYVTPNPVVLKRTKRTP
jgi:hypothetical protein